MSNDVKRSIAVKEQINKLETALADAFKAAPKIPANGITTLVRWMPWLALIFGIVQLIATIQLYNLGRRANDLVSGINDIARSFGVQSTAPELNVFYWIALAFIAVSGIMLLLAYPGLKEKKKVGWDWLFYGSLINVVYGFVSIFFDSYYGGGVSRFIFSLIGTLISFWLLFQVRPAYLHKESVHKA